MLHSEFSLLSHSVACHCSSPERVAEFMRELEVGGPLSEHLSVLFETDLGERRALLQLIVDTVAGGGDTLFTR